MVRFRLVFVGPPVLFQVLEVGSVMGGVPRPGEGAPFATVKNDQLLLTNTQRAVEIMVIPIRWTGRRRELLLVSPP